LKPLRLRVDTDLAARAIICVLFSMLCVNLFRDYAETGHVTGLLLLGSEVTVVVLTVFRRRATLVDRSVIAAVVTAISLGGPPILRASGEAGVVSDAATAAISALGLLNTHWGVILPRAAEAFGIFMVRQFMVSIPDELLEASELDGATPWQRLIYVVIPMMKPIILFTVIIATIIFFNVFAPVYVLTASAQGAPAYDFKVVIGEIYQNAFVFYRMGYAGAQSVALLVFVLCLVTIQFTLFRDRAR